MKVPYINFRNVMGRLHVECDGEIVGIFSPDVNKGEEFMRRMEQLRLLVADDVVDTMKYISNVVAKHKGEILKEKR